MYTEQSIWHNGILWCAIISWATAQLLKVFIYYIRNRSFDITRLVGAGGMPSSHSALVVALSAAVCIKYGAGSAEFAIAVIFSSIVMYDATGVRRAAGRQAATINRIVRDLADGHPLKNVQLKELLGHTPFEVLGGAVLGVAVAVLIHYNGWFML